MFVVWSDQICELNSFIATSRNDFLCVSLSDAEWKFQPVAGRAPVAAQRIVQRV